MKKKLIIYAIAFFIPVIIAAQKSDLKKWNLNGKIGTIKENFYKIDKDNSSSMVHYFVNIFNEQGNRTVDKKYLPGDKLDKIYNYSYDNMNRRTEKTGLDPDGNIIIKVTYQFDKKGNPILDKSVDKDGKPGKMIKSKFYKNGNVKEDKIFDGNGKLQKINKFSYDKNNNKTLSKVYNNDGKIEEETVYEYDADNNLINETIYRSDKTLVKKNVYHYEFDKYKNWTKKSVETDGKINSFWVRQYGYLE